MRRTSQLMSYWLALCLAGAGLVGLSPALHVWVEHGGQGPAHTHLSRPAPSPRSHVPSSGEWHAHDDGSVHRHIEAEGAGRVAARKPFFSHSQDSLGRTPDILAKLARTIRSIIVPLVPSSPGASHDTHQHESLAQLLAGGLAHATTDLSVEARPPDKVSLRPVFMPSAPSLAEWNAQTATRGPPDLHADSSSIQPPACG